MRDEDEPPAGEVRSKGRRCYRCDRKWNRCTCPCDVCGGPWKDCGCSAEDARENPAVLRGEWWIDNTGSTTYADGDVGDYNHEAIALEAALGVDLESVEPEIAGKLASYDFDDPGVAAYLTEQDADRDFLDWYARHPRSDARDYALEHMGWIRVKGDNFELWELTDEALRRIQNSDIWENADLEGEDAETADHSALIEEKSTGRYWDVPLAVLFDASDVRTLLAKLAREQPRSNPAGPRTVTAIFERIADRARAAGMGEIILLPPDRSARRGTRNYAFVNKDEKEIHFWPDDLDACCVEAILWHEVGHILDEQLKLKNEPNYSDDAEIRADQAVKEAFDVRVRYEPPEMVQCMRGSVYPRPRGLR